MRAVYSNSFLSLAPQIWASGVQLVFRASKDDEEYHNDYKSPRKNDRKNISLIFRDRLFMTSNTQRNPRHAVSFSNTGPMELVDDAIPKLHPTISHPSHVKSWETLPRHSPWSFDRLSAIARLAVCRFWCSLGRRCASTRHKKQKIIEEQCQINWTKSKTSKCIWKTMSSPSNSCAKHAFKHVQTGPNCSGEPRLLGTLCCPQAAGRKPLSRTIGLLTSTAKRSCGQKNQVISLKFE